MRIIPGEYIIELQDSDDTDVARKGFNCFSKLIVSPSNDYSISLLNEKKYAGSNRKVVSSHELKVEVTERDTLRYHNIIQTNYNFIATSGDLSSIYYDYNLKKQLSVKENYDYNLSGYGIYFLHMIRITNDLYWGYKMGNLFSESGDKYFSRVVFPGLMLRYYFIGNWFVSTELNLGINLSGLFSEELHTQKYDRAISKAFFNIGIGKNISKSLGIVLKYNKPTSPIYGEVNMQSPYGYPNNDSYYGEHYLNYMLTLGIEFGLW